MEYQLLYCPGTVYYIDTQIYAVPGRLQLRGRMNGQEWRDILGEEGMQGLEVPEGLRRLAPDRLPSPPTPGN